VSFKITITCPYNPGQDGLMIRNDLWLTTNWSTYGWPASSAVHYIWFPSSLSIACHTSEGWAGAQDISFLQEQNTMEAQTPGTRSEIVKVANSLEGAQQIANQVSTAIDFGMAAVLLITMIIGFKFGANTVNRAQGKGGDL